MGVQIHHPQSARESPKSHGRKGTGTAWATVNARRSHVMLHDGGEESRFTSPVRQGSGAQQQGDPGPSPRRIVTTHGQQEPGRQAPQRLPPRLTRPSTNPSSPLPCLLQPTGLRRVTCPRQTGRWRQAPRNTSRIGTPVTNRPLGVALVPTYAGAGPEQGARPGPGACCSAINSSAESDHVARPRQEQQ